MDVINLLFRCKHNNTTFPLTTKDKATHRKRTYVVCLGCGQEFEYDWSEKRRGEALPAIKCEAEG